MVSTVTSRGTLFHRMIRFAAVGVLGILAPLGLLVGLSAAFAAVLTSDNGTIFRPGSGMLSLIGHAVLSCIVAASLLWPRSSSARAVRRIPGRGPRRPGRSRPGPAASERLAREADDEHLLRYDVIVIGSGMGGLTAASCLAQTGYKVCVPKVHEVAGGATHEYSVPDENVRYKFSCGLHYVIPTCQQLLQISCGAPVPPVRFKRLGCGGEGGVYEKIRLTRCCRGDGAEDSLPITNEWQLREELHARFPGLSTQLERFETLAIEDLEDSNCNYMGVEYALMGKVVDGIELCDDFPDDIGLGDSGGTSHMTKDKKHLFDMVEEHVPIKFGDKKCCLQ